jgi:Tfp pilus assembly protein PilV
MDKTNEAAKKFSELLNTAIGAEGVARAVRLNATPEYAGCCASHDFCDANGVMAEAFAACGVKTFVDCSPEESEGPEYAAAVDLWNRAWDAAKAAGFDASKIA